MEVDQVQFNYSIIQMDQRYSATLGALRNNPPGATAAQAPGNTLDQYFNRTTAMTAGATLENQDIQDIFDSPLRAPHGKVRLSSDQTSTCAVDADPYQDDNGSSENDSEATALLFDADRWISNIEDLTVDFQSPEFQHWHWVITANFSQLGQAMQMSPIYSTLYPTTPLKLAGGHYGLCLDDSAVVRLLNSRCFLCDATLKSGADLLAHHQMAHGLIPNWFLRHFHLGMKCLQYHLQTLTIEISDQDIYQLCQVLIFRIQCISFLTDGGDGWLRGDGRHLGGSSSKRTTQTVPSDGGSKRRREETQGDQVREPEQWQWPQHSAPAPDSSTAADISDEARGHLTLPEPRLGVCGVLQLGPGGDSARAHEGQQRMEKQQGEARTTSPLSCLQDDRSPSYTVLEDNGSTSGERPTAERHQVWPDRSGRQVPLLELAQGATKAGSFQISSFDDGGDHGDVEHHQEQHPGPSCDIEVPQPAEIAGGSLTCSTVPMDGVEPNPLRPLARPAEIIASLKLATHTGQPTTRQSSEKCSSSAAPTEQKLTLRLCKNITGKSCYINSVALGLAWSSLEVEMMDEDWSDGGFFLTTCVHPTLVPLDVHHSFKSLLGDWLTTERINVQHDATEFARYLFSKLQPAAFDMTWWPKWSLADGPAMDQNLDDYPRGGKWDALSLTLPTADSGSLHCSDPFSLQQLINQWHDASGMCNVCIHKSRGKLLHVDRQVQSVKDLRQITSTDHVLIPHSDTYQDDIHWITYEAVAMTYHLGQHVESGHYRTLVQVRGAGSAKAWKDYEDSKLPDDFQSPTKHHLSNVTLIWMKQKPSPMSVEIFEEARGLYSLAVKGRETSIGEKDPRTLYTLSNFARFLSEAPEPSEELFKESDQLHERAVQSLKDLFQQGHPLTLASMHNQACSWLDRCIFQKNCSSGGPIDASVSQLRLVHKLRVEKLGKEHPDTQQTEWKLQEIARIQKQFANADPKVADQGNFETFPSFQDFFYAHFETVRTAEDFQQVRKHMHEGIVADLVFDDLLGAGFIDEDGFLTTGMQPFIFLVHIITGELVQRKCEAEQEYLGTYRDSFVVAHNKPESEEMWHSSDPSWIGKASMSQRHRFLVFKNLRWEYFNLISLGLECGSKDALEALKAMKDAAIHWVKHAPGWSNKTGFYLAAWPLTTVPCLHLHMVDLSCTGPSFERLSKKMLLLDDAIQVLEAEVAEGIGLVA
eukprot:symbB.v1.2.033357.t1/scaffold4121.1/size44329/8